MKTVRLSDEDYQALLEALEGAASDARAVDYEWSDEGAVRRAEEANRLHELIKPVEYEIVMDPDFKHLKQALGITEE